MVFQGPTRPGEDEDTFRETGKRKKKKQGPVRPDTDEDFFRKTGKTRRRSGGGSSGGGDTQPVGGFTTTEGENVLVTPEGLIVGEADPNLSTEEQQQSFAERSFEEVRGPNKFGGVAIQPSPEPQGFFGELQQKIGRKRRSLSQDDLFAQSIGVGLGVASVGTGVGEFATSLISSPIETVKGIPSGLVQTGRFITGGGLATQLREQPGFSTGQIVGEFALFKGTQAAAIKIPPRVTGFATRFDPAFKPVTKISRGDIIGDLSKIGGKGEIGLIPRGLERRGATIDPLKRGAFGFSKSEQAKFIGEAGPPVSSQADFKSFGTPLEREFFATPPLKGTGFARTSRLGLEDPKAASLLDIATGDFSFKKAKPSIITFPKETVGKGAFQPFGLPSSELETILLPGTVIKKTGRAGVSVIEGKRVPIFTAEVEKGVVGGLNPPKLSGGRGFGGSGFKSSDLVSSKPTISTSGLGISSFFSLGLTQSPGRSKLIDSPGIVKNPTGFSGKGKPSGGLGGFSGFSGLSKPLSPLNPPPPILPGTPTLNPPRKKKRPFDLGDVRTGLDFGTPIRIERKLTRTPSFAALQLNIRGKARKGEITGLIERPIPFKTPVKIGDLGPFFSKRNKLSF